MTSPMAFRATYADWKLIKTRGVVQVVMEVPLADSDAAYDVLGGMPNPANETWFAIAPLKLGKKAMQNNPISGTDDARPDPIQPPDRAKRDWRELPYAQQAGIRISEPTFAAYLREEHSDEWHETGDSDACLKMMCKIESKRDLNNHGRASTLWFQLDSAYQAWLAKERVGA